MDTRRPLLMLLLTASLLVATGCSPGGGSDGSTGPGTEAPTKQTGQAEDNAVADPAPIGEEATAGDWTIKVTEVTRAATAGGGSPSAGKELVVITFEVTNGASEGQGIGPTSFTLTDEEGTAYDAVPTSDPAFIFNTEQPIEADETREIKIAYDVTPAAGPFTWVFEPFGAPSAAVLAFD